MRCQKGRALPRSLAHILATSSSARIAFKPGVGLALGILGIVTLARLIALYFSTLDLFFDQSQYRSWSRELAFGYVTKPPLLAWIIAIVTHVAFAIPPLGLIAAIAFITRANANWAATAFVSCSIVAVALLVRLAAWKWLAVSIVFSLGLQSLLLIGDAWATKIRVPFGARGDLYARTLGWRSFAEQAGEMARRVGARTIVGDRHSETASLLYYWRDQPEQILAWLNRPTPADNFELTHPFTGCGTTNSICHRLPKSGAAVGLFLRRRRARRHRGSERSHGALL